MHYEKRMENRSEKFHFSYNTKKIPIEVCKSITFFVANWMLIRQHTLHILIRKQNTKQNLLHFGWRKFLGSDLISSLDDRGIYCERTT